MIHDPRAFRLPIFMALWAVVALALILLLTSGLSLSAFIETVSEQRYKYGILSGVLYGLAFALFYSMRRRARRDMPQRLTRAVLNKIDWRRFEMLCEDYFAITGYRVKPTRQGADGGVDIVIHPPRSKKTIYVQCKAWTNGVGVKPVRELFGVMTADKVKHGIVLITETFTSDAHAFAKANGVQLIDGPELIARLDALHPAEQRQVLKRALAMETALE